MNHDDPFFSQDHDGPTVIRPMPGGRRPRPAAPSAPQPAAFSGAPTAELGISDASNPLVGCASGLISVAAQLRRALSHPDPSALRDQLTRQVNSFEQCARARGLADNVVLPARYVLCSLLDESILDTPWGSQSVWGERGLLVTFHNETWGGEKFFDVLDRLLAYPSGNLQLLELMYLCLAMGFEGRYRVRDGGRNELQQVRERLYLAIRDQRGEPEAELSPHWQGIGRQRDPLLHQLPLWVASAVVGLALLGLFAFLSFSLHRASDPVFAGLAQAGKGFSLAVERPERTTALTTSATDAMPERPSAERIAPLTLRMLLADDIAAGRVEVIDKPLGQTVVLRGDGLFASGRSEVQPGFLPQLKRIAEAMSQLPGRVLITGHTDSVPIRTLRFPSNQVLSQARADNVKTILVDAMGSGERLSAEGRADTELRVPERPADARNRRVEITLIRDGRPARLTDPDSTA